jgi:putative methionine-R-sulfoxide reductase with GAF domain
MFEFKTVKQDTGNNPDNSNLLSGHEQPTAATSSGIESFKAKFSYQGKNLIVFSQLLLSAIAREKEISKGVFFIAEKVNKKNILRLISGYACDEILDNREIVEFGEGFPGQVAKDGKLININNIPEGYMTIESGLGKASPVSLIIFPIIYEEKVLAVVELASFLKFTQEDEEFFENLSPLVAEQILKCLKKD